MITRILALVFLGAGAVCAENPPIEHDLRREVWRGTLHQTSPMAWDGPIEIYLRFEEEKAPPKPLTGVISWPTLGDAKTEISGTMLSDTELEFAEKRCLSGDCSKLVLGGRYRAKVDPGGKHLSGEATGPFGLHGRFDLERWRAQ